MSKTNLRILSADDFMVAVQTKNVELLPVPELGPDVAVEIRPLTLGERREMDKKSRDRKTNTIDGIRAEVLTVIYGMVNPRLSESHVIGLDEANGAAIDRIAKRILEISGLTNSVNLTDEAVNEAGND